MHFLMICRHRPGMERLRDEVRPRHRAHVASGGNGLARVLIGSALTEEDGETSIGNFGILEAESREKALAFAEADPFMQAGIVEEIEIIPLASRFQAERISPMTA